MTLTVSWSGVVPVRPHAPLGDTGHMGIPNSKPFFAMTFVASLVLFACGSDGPEDAGQTTSTAVEVVSEEVSDDPTEALPASDETTTSAPVVPPTIEDVDDLTELIGLDVSPCAAPLDQEFYVDVALDDPDGGLNMRSAPGIKNDIVGVFPRSSALVTTGACATLDTLDWWKVMNPDATLDGWVSSRFLSELLVFNPGLGKSFEDLENVGISGESLDDIATQLAEAYGFDEDVVITVVEEPEAIDAIGGSITYDLTGLKDDASDGYRVEIDFVFDKNETDTGEIVSYTTLKITNYGLCSRGVTEDGLCT